jgi:hypothetical protein
MSLRRMVRDVSKLATESERTDVGTILIPRPVGFKRFVGNGKRVFAGLTRWFPSNEGVLANLGPCFETDVLYDDLISH